MLNFSLPYIVQGSKGQKIFLFCGYIFVLTVFYLTNMFEFWLHSPWWIKLLLPFVFIALHYGTASALFEKTIFDETGIDHRTWYLRRKKYPYSDISFLMIDTRHWKPDQRLIIKFLDGIRIKLSKGDGDLSIVYEILKTYIPPDHELTIKYKEYEHK